MKKVQVQGLHHVTLVGSTKRAAIDFWQGLLGMPFLTSRYGYVSVPGTERPIGWTTVLLFDLGVFLVVLGVVQMMINTLSEEAEAE